MGERQQRSIRALLDMMAGVGSEPATEHDINHQTFLNVAPSFTRQSQRERESVQMTSGIDGDFRIPSTVVFRAIPISP